jgi:hypothetical protein
MLGEGSVVAFRSPRRPERGELSTPKVTGLRSFLRRPARKGLPKSCQRRTLSQHFHLRYPEVGIRIYDKAKMLQMYTRAELFKLEVLCALSCRADRRFN